MKSSKKERVHVWGIKVDVPEPIVHRCTRCGWETVPGKPLPMPEKENCGQRPKTGS